MVTITPKKSPLLLPTKTLKRLASKKTKSTLNSSWKLGVVVTIMVFASIVGVKMTFEYVVSQQLDDCGYSYNEAQLHQPIKSTLDALISAMSKEQNNEPQEVL